MPRRGIVIVITQFVVKFVIEITSQGKTTLLSPKTSSAVSSKKRKVAWNQKFGGGLVFEYPRRGAGEGETVSGGLIGGRGFWQLAPPVPRCRQVLPM